MACMYSFNEALDYPVGDVMFSLIGNVSCNFFSIH